MHRGRRRALSSFDGNRIAWRACNCKRSLRCARRPGDRAYSAEPKPFRRFGKDRRAASFQPAAPSMRAHACEHGCAKKRYGTRHRDSVSQTPAGAREKRALSSRPAAWTGPFLKPESSPTCDLCRRFWPPFLPGDACCLPDGGWPGGKERGLAVQSSARCKKESAGDRSPRQGNGPLVSRSTGGPVTVYAGYACFQGGKTGTRIRQMRQPPTASGLAKQKTCGNPQALSRSAFPRRLIKETVCRLFYSPIKERRFSVLGQAERPRCKPPRPWKCF